MKKYDALISDLKNQKANFKKEFTWQRIENTLDSQASASPVGIFKPARLIPAVALCSLALMFGLSFSVLNHPGVDQYLSKVGGMTNSPEQFYENTAYNTEL